MKKLLILALTLFVLVGCQKSGEEFVGSWVNDHNGKEMVIKKDGNSFLIVVSGKDTLAATVQDNHLNVNAPIVGVLPITKLDNGEIEFSYFQLCDNCNRWTRKK